MKKPIVIIALLLIAFFIGYKYIYQSHREIATETAKFEMNAEVLASSFLTDAKSAEEKYLNITINVSGNISEITNTSITLDKKVFCLFSEEIQIGKRNTVKIKGRVIGYDDLLEQVKLDQCIIN